MFVFGLDCSQNNEAPTRSKSKKKRRKRKSRSKSRTEEYEKKLSTTNDTNYQNTLAQDINNLQLGLTLFLGHPVL